MAQANLTFNIRLQNYDIPYKPPNNNTFFRPNFCTKGPLFCPNFGVHAVRNAYKYHAHDGPHPGHQRLQDTRPAPARRLHRSPRRAALRHQLRLAQHLGHHSRRHLPEVGPHARTGMNKPDYFDIFCLQKLDNPLPKGLQSSIGALWRILSESSQLYVSNYKKTFSQL